MQIVIDIPETMVQDLKDGCFGVKHNIYELAGAVCDGVVLPKNHGRLIDADDIDNHIIGHVDTRCCPTIIEADKAESEDKE